MRSACSIVADIGGTNARFATLINNVAPLECVQILPCANFVRIDAAIRHYLHTQVEPLGLKLDAICLAVAGHVNGDHMKILNNHWEFSQQYLRRQFQCDLYVINDFTAQAMSLHTLSEEHLRWLRSPTMAHRQHKTKAVIGPGTGLGVAALTPNGEVIDSEAGHCTVAAVTVEQQEIVNYLRRYYPRVSVERLVSGPGLANIHAALTALSGTEIKIQPEQITAGAQQGDSQCLATINEFNIMLGTVCGDLALALGAVGGVYLSGGVLKKMGPLFDPAVFLQHFDAKGRFQQYCRNIPIALMTVDYPGLIGAAHYLSQRLTEKPIYECQ